MLVQAIRDVVPAPQTVHTEHVLWPVADANMPLEQDVQALACDWVEYVPEGHPAHTVFTPALQAVTTYAPGEQVEQAHAVPVLVKPVLHAHEVQSLNTL